MDDIQTEHIVLEPPAEAVPQELIDAFATRVPMKEEIGALSHQDIVIAHAVAHGMWAQVEIDGQARACSEFLEPQDVINFHTAIVARAKSLGIEHTPSGSLDEASVKIEEQAKSTHSSPGEVAENVHPVTPKKKKKKRRIPVTDGFGGRVVGEVISLKEHNGTYFGNISIEDPEMMKRIQGQGDLGDISISMASASYVKGIKNAATLLNDLFGGISEVSPESDGLPFLIAFNQGGVKIVSDSGQDVTEQAIEIARAVTGWAQENGVSTAVLDARLVAYGSDGKQMPIGVLEEMLESGVREEGGPALVANIFDLPFIDGQDVSGESEDKRMQRLTEMIWPQSTETPDPSKGVNLAVSLQEGLPAAEPEGGIHAHGLDREETGATLVDGPHVHIYLLPDGTIVKTEEDGDHSHPIEGDRTAVAGKHAHVVRLPDGTELRTEEDGEHDHDLLVRTTGFDGTHAHVLKLTDGTEITSMSPAEFAERFPDEVGSPSSPGPASKIIREEVVVKKLGDIYQVVEKESGDVFAIRPTKEGAEAFARRYNVEASERILAGFVIRKRDNDYVVVDDEAEEIVATFSTAASAQADADRRNSSAREAQKQGDFAALSVVD